MKQVNVLGINFEHTTSQEFLGVLQHRIQTNKKTFIVTANPEIVMYAVNHPEYMKTVQSADYTIADGTGVILASKLLKTPLPERIAGFDLMKALLAIANRDRLRVFFLGAREEVIEKTVENVKNDYPYLKIAGYHHGFFQENDRTIAEMVKKADPDLIFVALGFPKQEYWIQNHLREFNKGIFIGVGGSFDILAGMAKRAPAFWLKFNIEWLYRLIQQPSRWKRMAVLPLFVKKVLKSRKHLQ